MANAPTGSFKLPDRDELARLLSEAAEAHHEYEQRLGRRDEDWPRWYAQYIIERVTES